MKTEIRIEETLVLSDKSKDHHQDFKDVLPSLNKVITDLMILKQKIESGNVQAKDFGEGIKGLAHFVNSCEMVFINKIINE